VKSGGCDPQISINRDEVTLRRAFHNIICSQATESPARLVRYFFSLMVTPRILYCQWVGLVCDPYLGGEEAIGGFELAAGVGVGDGQP
jgi:hypothetical protein